MKRVYDIFYNHDLYVPKDVDIIKYIKLKVEVSQEFDENDRG